MQIASLRMQEATSSQENVVLLTRRMIKESRDYLKKNSGVLKWCVRVAKPIVATIEKVTSTNSVAREKSGDGPISNYRSVKEAVNVTSTNRKFRTMKLSVATYEQTKKGLSFSYPKRLVDEDAIHTKPLVVKNFLWMWSLSSIHSIYLHLLVLLFYTF